MATFVISIDEKGRYTLGGGTHGSLEDLVFAVGPTMLHDPVNGVDLMLGNAVLVSLRSWLPTMVYTSSLAPHVICTP